MPTDFVDKYGQRWNDKPNNLQIELHQIRVKYFTKHPDLLKHYLAAHKELWPEDRQHRWFVMGIKSLVENKVTCLLGCASSGKTYLMASHALIDFWAFPRTSLSLLSSTDIRSLELRVWGRGVKNLFNRAKNRFPELPGYILESQRAIVPDDIDDDGEFARELNKGIICVPCVSGGRFVGMSKFQGIKPPDSPGKSDGILKHYGDESALMQVGYLDAYTNWMVNKNFKGCQAGNPTDISDPLCTASEPVGGWDCFQDNGKTQEWKSKWYGAHCIAYDGRDTPNNDEPKDSFHFLAPSDFISQLISTHGEDSWQLWQHGIGKPSRGMVSNRVITIGICESGKAFDTVVWREPPSVKIASLDPAFGGGDRCVWREGEIGIGINGAEILSVGPPEIIPIRLNSGVEAEDQIAQFVKTRSDQRKIPPQNIFYDSFGSGLLGNSFALVFGFTCPIPVNSGGNTTDRPVRFDLFKKENGQPVLVKCSEYYSKFVTEMWHSTREAIQASQIRGLDMETAREGQLRMYSVVKGSKIEVESKDDMKERVRKSPDLYDNFAIMVEGARQLGFKIIRLGSDKAVEVKTNFLVESQQETESILSEALLNHG